MPGVVPACRYPCSPPGLLPLRHSRWWGAVQRVLPLPALVPTGVRQAAPVDPTLLAKFPYRRPLEWWRTATLLDGLTAGVGGRSRRITFTYDDYDPSAKRMSQPEDIHVIARHPVVDVGYVWVSLTQAWWKGQQPAERAASVEEAVQYGASGDTAAVIAAAFAADKHRSEPGSSAASCAARLIYNTEQNDGPFASLTLIGLAHSELAPAIAVELNGLKRGGMPTY